MARKRIVRKQPLFDRIRSYPLDLLLSLNEQRLSIDWDDHVPQCFPIGTVLSLLFLVLCKIRTHYVSVNDKRDNSLFRSDYSTYQQVVSRAVNGVQAAPVVAKKIQHDSVAHTLLWIVNVLLVVLFAASLLNAVHVYVFPYRNYTLLGRSTNSPKPGASRVTRQNVSNATPRGFLSAVYSYFEEHSYYETDESDGDTTYEPRYLEKDVWMMTVWDPSHFSLYAAASFSPIILATGWLFSAVSLWKLALFTATSNAFTAYLTSKFLQLVSDKQIIYQETFNEYNKKYVIPKTSVLRKNASVDATHGPYAPANKTVHDDPVGHLQNDFAFVTHDINGSRLKKVRADFLDTQSRSSSPFKNIENNSFLPPASSHSSRYDTSRPTYHDDTTRYSHVTSSTPFASRNMGNESFLNRDSYARANETFSRGHDSFSRTSSRAHSPFKSPSRLGYTPNFSYSERTQLSPNRSGRQSSPQRSPSPSKRVWH